MRKRLLFVLLTLSFGLTGMWGQEVSEKEAQVKAQKFVNSHYGRKGGGSELKSLGQVNGLYVFNMNDKGGFVIVSNDERATDILGYSESGQFDPDNMPDNMRAWLQGYADEIAWAQKNIKEVSETNTKTRAHTRSDAKATIAPMVTTKWNQRAPYNNLCPEYNPGKKAVTGCVATAMAQVMYYTEKKAYTGTDFPNNTTTTTQKIEPYDWKYNGITYTSESIPAGSVIEWGNMLDNYVSKDPNTGNTIINGTEAQQNAVATLMKYCGYSVQMNYGPSSSSNSIMVANALTTYFNYSSTTKVVSRGCYSYANWIDLIYHELEKGRPVVYSGQSYGGGHEFVCDGYDKETDLFHINWGWGGTSDGYFVLSSLNPDEQGAGGSSTNDGYHFGQDAVVGIQKAGDTDPVLNVPTNKYTLTINDISISHNTIALGESVDITLNVTNSGTEAYDGDLLLVKGGYVFWGEMFIIPANTTDNYVIHYTPTNAGTETISSVFTKNDSDFSSPSNAVTLNTVNQTPTDLTTTDIGSTTASIGWTNVGNANKWNLRSKSFSVTTEDFNGDPSWTVGNWNGDSYTWRKESTAGINGTPCYASPSYIEGTSLNPYDWLISPKFDLGGKISFYAWGENECFCFWVSTDGENWTSVSQVITATNTAKLYTFDISEYEGNEGYIAIVHQNSSGHTSESYLYVDDVSHMVPNGDWTTISNVTTNPYILTGLTSSTYYEVKLQAVNNDGGKWSSSVSFITEAFPSPENLTVSEVTPISALISWNGSADSYDVRYGVRSDDYGNEPTWLKYDNDTYKTNVGSGNEEEHTWGVMYPGSQVTGSKLTKVAFYESSYNTNDITVEIYSGGENAPGTRLATTVVKPLSNGFHEVTFESPVEITLGANLWIILKETDTHPMVSCTKTDELNNQWRFYKSNSSWQREINYGWMIRGYIEPETIEWSTPVNCTEQSYKLTGLDPTKNYTVQVRGSYNSGGFSAWATTTFNKALSGSLELENGNNNVGLIEGWNGYTTTVTLKDRTLYKDDAWNTICLPFSLDATQLAASPLAGADIRALSSGSLEGDVLTLNFTPAAPAQGAITEIVAGTPYIIKWASGDNLVNPIFNGVMIDKTKHDVTFTGGKFVGTYESQTFTENNTSILLVGEGNTLYYPQQGASIGAQRAYFQIGSNSNIRAFNLDFGDEDVTAISPSPVLSQNGDEWYDLSGRKLIGKPVKKGVYVQNGKKVVIK